ncbi:MAG: hypothetical protein M5U12_16365 [Verrucomicrobia bacterium]|nr:hypothetical protein [Verrucomicrobiota bacterium]
MWRRRGRFRNCCTGRRSVCTPARTSSGRIGARSRTSSRSPPGFADGLGFGDNAKAALVTRALAEMRRLGVACGAQPETFSGLSGLGDLVVTCFSSLSRNHTLGERLGRGERLADILAGSVAVAEGYPTARAARQLAQRHGVATPVMDEVYAMLYEGKNPQQALQDLTRRGSKPED